MRFLTSFAILAVLGVLCSPAFGQCVMPYTEDFETASGTTPPAGWSLDPTAAQPWTADSGGTSSTATGPSIDHNPGTSAGIYLYLETSTGAVGNQAILNSPVYDVSGLANGCVIFWYHMWGATMGTLALEVWDGSVWFPAWSAGPGDQGNVWRQAIVGLPAYADMSCSIASKFRFVGTRGTSFTSDMAIDDVTVGQCPPVEWQVNSPAMSLDVDGVTGDAFFFPAIVPKGTTCPPLMPQTSTLTISSAQVGAVYDVVISSSPIVPASGSITIGGQVVNVNVFQPFVWLSSGTATGGITTFPSWFPGATSSTISGSFTLTGQSTMSMQGLVFAPSAPAGFVLSQATQLDVNITPPPTSIPGPINTSTSVSVDVTSGPTCWVAGGVPFYGSTFSTIHVSPNGFVSFGGTDTDSSPSVAEAIADDGRVGFWTDLDPADGGMITISNPAANIIRVDWAGVFYNTGGPGNTFGIQFDCGTGVIQIDGLGGLMPNPGISVTDDQWLGICPGITFAPAVTTDPGAAPFGLGANGFAAAATDMLYEFNDTSVSMSGLPASVVGGMTTLVFSPTAVGMGVNYAWAGM